MPGVPLVALFETAFYQWAPEAAMRYAVPEAWHRGGRAPLGFSRRQPQIHRRAVGANCSAARTWPNAPANFTLTAAKVPFAQPALRVISCHLGGSSSVTGILNGVAIGNSMGLSPQSGLPQNNRVGDLDAFALPFAHARDAA